MIGPAVPPAHPLPRPARPVSAAVPAGQESAPGPGAADGRAAAPGETRRGGTAAGPAAHGGDGRLTLEQQREVARLKAIDRQVRAHEQAHLAAAGGLARGGASFQFQEGPDGRLYAVAGEVAIDTSRVANDPAATVVKARRIQRAATAPADPSPQDRQVAAQARAMELEAQAQLREQRREEAGGAVADTAAAMGRQLARAFGVAPEGNAAGGMVNVSV